MIYNLTLDEEARENLLKQPSDNKQFNIYKIESAQELIWQVS